MEAESSFTNVFGHDPCPNPIKSIHGQPNLVVTEALYKAYVHHRDNGEGCQGVGPMQLTAKFLQDRADELGGCFKPGAEHPHRGRAPGSAHKGARQHARRLVGYNGSTAYADAVIKLQRVWHDAAGGARVRAASNGHGSHAGHARRPTRPASRGRCA